MKAAASAQSATPMNRYGLPPSWKEVIGALISVSPRFRMEEVATIHGATAGPDARAGACALHPGGVAAANAHTSSQLHIHLRARREADGRAQPPDRCR